MMNRKDLLKCFMKIGAYCRAAILTRGLEIYLEYYHDKRKNELDNIINLFWQFCAGLHEADKWDEYMWEYLDRYTKKNGFWPEIKIFNDEALPSIILDMDEFVKICEYFYFTTKTERTDLFELFYKVIKGLDDKSVSLGSLTEIIAFGQKSRKLSDFILGRRIYYFGNSFTRDEVLPFIEFKVKGI